MASWQYNLFIVSKAKVHQLGCHDRIDEKLYSETDWWDGSLSYREVASRIDAFIDRRNSWCDSLMTWGVEDGNRVDMLVDAELISELQVRLDLRNLSESFIQQIVALADSIGGVFCADDGALIPADMRFVVAALGHSDAARFTANPLRFIKTLSSDPDTHEG